MTCGALCSADMLKRSTLFSLPPFSTFRNEQLAQRAEDLTHLFEQEPRQEPAAAQSNPHVLAGRRFFKNFPSIVDSRIDTCRREHLALKLGIPGDVFAFNPGFEKFATDSHLERYLMEYHHTLHVNPHTQELSIRANGEYVQWAEAAHLLAHFSQPSVSPRLPWVYGQDGIQGDDMYNWKTLKPYKRTDASQWGFRYIFELVVCCADTPHKTGDHGFLRLKTPDGAVYSVGLYRPGKRGLSDNLKFPFRLKRGYLMMPDVTEFWPCEIRSLQVAITQQQFDVMKGRIEYEKAQDKLIFQLFQSNCVLWAKHIAESAEIPLPSTDDTITRLLTPRRIQPLVDSCCSLMPSCVKTAASIPIAIVVNSLQLVLGAGVVDKEVRLRNGPHIRPHIASLADLFRPSKMKLHHPYTFGNETLRWVQEWRDRETARLEQTRATCGDQEALDRQIDEIRYCIPQE